MTVIHPDRYINETARRMPELTGRDEIEEVLDRLVEEAPFFYGDEMGSNLYAARAQAQGERIEAMLSLETPGYYTDEPDTNVSLPVQLVLSGYR